jgi:hypothetical protein
MTPQGASRPRPVVLGLVGLALMIAGWKLSAYRPLTPRQEEQARRFAEVRESARDDPKLTGELDRIKPHVEPTPPYQVPGRLALFAGLALFVTAGVLMYRQPPPAEEPPGEADDAAGVPAP